MDEPKSGMRGVYFQLWAIPGSPKSLSNPWRGIEKTPEVYGGMPAKKVGKSNPGFASKLG
jgi:hypothetical protein